jgi:transglutaminase-like putative cysteine protease
MRFIAGLVIAAFATPAAALNDVAIVGAYVCDAQGNPKAIRLGNPFWVGARFRVTGNISLPYRFRVETPYARFESGRLSYGTEPGEYTVFWGPIPTLMDGPIDVRATLDPERRNREPWGNNSAAFTYTPTSPAEPIEYFAPKALNGALGIRIEFAPSSAIPNRVVTWIPLPSGETFQDVEAPEISASALTAEAAPFAQPVATTTFHPTDRTPIVEKADLYTTAFSARSNIALLAELGSSADPDMAVWLRPEKLIEVGRPEFERWADSVVPPAVRAAGSTVETARELYRSILRQAQYRPQPGILPSALKTLRERRGDCGGLSALFVALCRTAGIPARTVAGFGKGSDNWHVWAEFHVHGAGWIPVDPAFAEGKLPDGADLPIYFGVIPELNDRIATGFGFDRFMDGLERPMLQSPAAFWFGRGVRVQKVSVQSSLSTD